MTSSSEEGPSSRQGQADFAQAFHDIARGERTATALENQLASMEAKLDALLAEAEQRQAEAQKVQTNGIGSSTADEVDEGKKEDSA